ncbi:MAG: adenylosuccinate lyase [Pseudomonadota bacterium]|nr:adenylosuccinate lyase [Pseudomonadota bacterium]QKK06131.1 MAG: adenylosuccinate lyase [Pseudomonadota bacterium]
MLDRFTRPEMAEIWSTENRFRIWLEVETLASEAQEKLGVIPEGTAAAIRERGNFDAARVDDIEKETRHDVIAFLTNVAEYVGEEARFLHQGMTSSDMLDTSFAVQLRQAADLILDGIRKLLTVLERRMLESQDMLCIGRSHGVHAEPMTFGVKLASHYAAFKRAEKRMEAAREEISTCAISGAVGMFSTISPEVEAYVAEKLDLKIEPVSTQIIPRDRHAAYFAALSLVACSIEHLATETRNLQRTEIREAEEFFAAGQKGSSAMPHKRNPILGENLTGLARIVRGYTTPAFENVTLWHERDISHSSVERVIAPDATVTLDFALHRLIGVMDKLVLYPDNMRRNLEQLKGLPFSHAVLLALTQKGMSREGAYGAVQECAMKTWESQDRTFPDFLKANDNIIKHLPPEEIDSLCNLERYTRHSRDIVQRVLKES